MQCIPIPGHLIENSGISTIMYITIGTRTEGSLIHKKKTVPFRSTACRYMIGIYGDSPTQKAYPVCDSCFGKCLHK